MERITSVKSIWGVTDPRDKSELNDIYFSTSLDELATMFVGGVDPVEENLTIYTDQDAAHDDALERLLRRDLIAQRKDS